jgi:His-Xaa-Ser system protein HxsD
MTSPTKQSEPGQGLPVFSFRDDAIRLCVDLAVYRLSAIQKTGYRLAARCTVVLGEMEGSQVSVTLLFRSGTAQSDAMEVARLFFQELLDQELREQVGEETKPLRNLIIAQAFSKTDLIRRE